MPWISDEDAKRLARAKAEDAHIAERFRIKTQCSECGYQSMNIYPEQHCMCPMAHCSGTMVERERNEPRT